MTDTRHLDTAIAIFKGKPSARRAPKNRVFYAIAMGETVWCITHNGKMLEDGLDQETAIAHAQERAARASAATGKEYSYALME